MKDLHVLPKVRDSWSFLYVEHSKVEQEGKAIALLDEDGKVAVPCAAITTLMLGPGCSVSHAAIRALADNGCLVLWCGEQGVRFYAQGMGETRSSRSLLWQARVWADSSTRMEVVRRLYQKRFTEPLDPDLTLQQIRGMEGIRVRSAYRRASRETSVDWTGRSYKPGQWAAADPVNRALSAANSCLYGVCHAAIVSAGYSPALGFIHTGKMLSFVYDVGDLYKADLTIPLAFKAAAAVTKDLESVVRRSCRDAFHGSRLLQRIVPDLEWILNVGEMLPEEDRGDWDYDAEEALPGGLWGPDEGEVAGGVNWGDEASGSP